jgi:hypothetical protein
MAEFQVNLSMNPEEHTTTVNILSQGVIALERMRDDMVDKLEIDFEYVDEEAFQAIEFVNNEIVIARAVVEKLLTVDN